MDVKLILESILFAAQKPLSTREIREIFSNAAEQSSDETAKSLKKIKEDDLLAELELLQKDFESLQRSFRLSCVAGSWQLVSQQAYAPWIMALVGAKIRPPRLSQPSLETLAILAYRQPITRAEIEQIRGVAVDGVMQTLLERGLVESVGRAEVVGRPITYGTTALFLEYFGLRSLDDLPAGDELRRLVIKKPEVLLTADNNATSAAETGFVTSVPEALLTQIETEGETSTPSPPTKETIAEVPRDESAGETGPGPEQHSNS